jgi:hypothetical protein
MQIPKDVGCQPLECGDRGACYVAAEGPCLVQVYDRAEIAC